ncbi:DUF4153 domain-containing protein [Paenibacillus aestuarii]|uniref:DUF4153 domain-containing protein n=1 Tax=Paenibacillus aestuarii TaxID=516965 RepID=A0ABW0K274_9BACL|nr:DUF4153 domain-containing protein [Paenibacillus aestuarii]
MDISHLITHHRTNPYELEQMFRKDPEAFKKSFPSVWEQNQDSLLLAAWHERLHFKEAGGKATAPFWQRNFMSMGILALMAGLASRILFHYVEQQTIAPINLIFGILPFIAAYFIYNNPPRKSVIYVLASIFLISGVYLNLLPLKPSDSTILAYMHLPILLWVVVGVAFTGNEYGRGNTRLAYLKFNGEFGILYASMAISGMLLFGLTNQLFQVAGMEISEFYFKNVVLFGAAALTVVATYLVSRNLRLSRHIAPYIAKIFSPLVLVTLVVYLITVIGVGKNPFLDRNFLMIFNGILLCVLAVTIFSITENGTEANRGISDYINFALIILALIIDSVALSAIVFRLSSYGITPNRMAVLGINILIWANLIWILFPYLQFLRGKAGSFIVQNAVTKYLPLYGVWAAIVTFVFPIIFR